MKWRVVRDSPPSPDGDGPSEEGFEEARDIVGKVEGDGAVRLVRVCGTASDRWEGFGVAEFDGPAMVGGGGGGIEALFVGLDGAAVASADTVGGCVKASAECCFGIEVVFVSGVPARYPLFLELSSPPLSRNWLASVVAFQVAYLILSWVYAKSRK